MLLKIDGDSDIADTFKFIYSTLCASSWIKWYKITAIIKKLKEDYDNVLKTETDRIIACEQAAKVLQTYLDRPIERLMEEWCEDFNAANGLYLPLPEFAGELSIDIKSNTILLLIDSSIYSEELKRILQREINNYLITRASKEK